MYVKGFMTAGVRASIRKIPLIDCVFFASLIILISGMHGYLFDAAGSFILLIAFLLMALPISRMLFGSGACAIIFAFPIGFIFHAFFLSLWGKFFGITRISFLSYLIIAATLVYILTKVTKPSSNETVEEKTLQNWEAADTRFLFIWLILTIALVSLPLAQVGIETAKGYAYRAYFNADFFRNMAVVGSLENSGIPPNNPYFSGATLHYYWFFHIVVSYWKTLFPSFRLDFILVQFTLVTISIFVALLLVTLRRFINSRQTLAWLFPLFAFGGSYKGIFAVYELQEKNLHFHTFTAWNIEGILRWLWHVPQIDTIYRVLIFGPQHVMVLSVFLILLTLFEAERSRISWILCCILVFLSLGFSLIVGAILVLSTELLLVYQVIRSFKNKWQEAVIFNALGLFFFFLFRNVFQMFEPQFHQIIPGIDWAILKHLPLYMILNWGALLIFGVAGMFWGSQQFPRKRLFIFLALSFALIFFVKLNLPGASDFSLKGGYLSHVVLVFFSAAWLDRILTGSSFPKRWLILAVSLFATPGLITWMMDAYNCQDTKNSAFTTYINRQDTALFGWIRENLPRDAIVQQSLSGKGYLNQFVTEIPPFTGRSVFLGDKNLSRIYQIPQDKIAQREKIVSRLFQEDSPSGIFEIARASGINYFLFASKSVSQSHEMKQQLVEPLFKLLHQEDSSMVFQVASNAQLGSVEETILLKERERPILRARFANNFYPREFHNKTHDPLRWISNDGIILIHSEREITGQVEFIAHSFRHSRQMKIYLNQQLVHEQEVSYAGTQITAPIRFLKGENKIQIRSLDEPEQASIYEGNKDTRLLSFRILHFKFVTS